MQDRSAPRKPAPRRSARPRAGDGAAVPAWGDALPTPEERAALKRSTIIREAARCFNRGGFHGTSMDDIARRLGVTKAALYRYVPTKHDVLLASFDIAMDASFASLDRGEREGTTGLEKLRIAMRGYLEDLIGKLGHPVVLLEDSALLPNQLRSLIRRRDEAERRYRALVKQGIDDGSIRPCDPKLAVFALMGAINWVPKWYRDDGAWTPEQVAETLVDLILQSIAAPSDGRGAAPPDNKRSSGERRSNSSPTPKRQEETS